MSLNFVQKEIGSSLVYFGDAPLAREYDVLRLYWKFTIVLKLLNLLYFLICWMTSKKSSRLVYKHIFMSVQSCTFRHDPSSKVVLWKWEIQIDNSSGRTSCMSYLEPYLVFHLCDFKKLKGMATRKFVWSFVLIKHTLGRFWEYNTECETWLNANKEVAMCMRSQGYKLVLTGHSLGGSIASLLSMLLMHYTEGGPYAPRTIHGIHPSKLFCFGFGSAPCVDRNLAEFSNHIVNVVLQVTACHAISNEVKFCWVGQTRFCEVQIVIDLECTGRFAGIGYSRIACFMTVQIWTTIKFSKCLWLCRRVFILFPICLSTASLFGIGLSMEMGRARLGKTWIICIWCS